MRFASTGLPDASAPGNCSPSGAGPSAGFTLLEALIAIVVLAIGLGTLYQAFGTGVRAIPVAEDHLAARQLAQSLLEEHLTARAMRAGRANGTHDRFTWEIVMAPAAREYTPAPRQDGWQLMEIAVVVGWPPRRQVRLDTLHMVRTETPRSTQ